MIRRRLLTVAATGTVVMVAGVFGGAGPLGAEPGEATRPLSTQLDYTCEFPSGPRQLGVLISAGYPASGAVGEPIRPDGVTVAVTVPDTALADLTALNAATVAGTAELTVSVNQGTEATTAAWTGLAVPAVPVPAEGDLELVASGPVPSVTVGAPGDVTLTADTLRLELTPKQADGTPTDPATLALACQISAAQDPTLAVIPVPPVETPPSSSTPPTTPGGEDPGSGIEIAPPQDGAGRGTPRQQDGEIPPDCFKFDNSPTAGPMCAFIAGYSNVAKLNGSVLLGVGPEEPNLHISLGDSLVVHPRGSPECPDDGEWLCMYAIDTISSATLEMPPARATFLVFGFMPVTATLSLTEAEYAHIVSRSFRYLRPDPPASRFPLVVTSTSAMSARISGVMVNGVPFDVGKACRPERDLAVELHGSSANQVPQDPWEYTVPYGGPLDGMITIPPFSGCRTVTGEDLDRLFTGLVSGPGNYVKMTQGMPCPQDSPLPGACPPAKVTDPQR